MCKWIQHSFPCWSLPTVWYCTHTFGLTPILDCSLFLARKITLYALKLPMHALQQLCPQRRRLIEGEYPALEGVGG